jgi:hypothetical protein
MALGQFAVFDDVALQRRTFQSAFGTLCMRVPIISHSSSIAGIDSAVDSSWMEFKQSAAQMIAVDLMETGSTELAQLFYNADASLTNNTLQFMAGVRYFNRSGDGLMSWAGGCGGSWACDPLVDWPTGTRDGYVIDGNDEDVIRNVMGAIALSGLADIALALGKPTDQATYSAAAASIVAGINTHMLVRNGSYAYYRDGKGQTHAAIQSTIYAAAGGAADDQPQLAAAVTSYLQQHGLAPASCMTGRWWLQALYRLALYDPAGTGALVAQQFLETEAYPSWGNMIAQGATTAMEAWRPADKANLDWAHPWCAAPAALIPRGTMGLQPLKPCWAQWRIAPQPGTIAVLNMTAPIHTCSSNATALITASLDNSQSTQIVLVILVPHTTSGVVCLPPPIGTQSANVLVVDGTIDPAPVSLGRMLCTGTATLQPGSHTVARRVS